VAWYWDNVRFRRIDRSPLQNFVCKNAVPWPVFRWSCLTYLGEGRDSWKTSRIAVRKILNRSKSTFRACLSYWLTTSRPFEAPYPDR